MTGVDPVAAFAAALRALKDRSGQSFRALAGPSLTSAAALHRYCTGVAVPPDFDVVMRFAKANRAKRDDVVRVHHLWLQARLAVEAAGGVTTTTTTTAADTAPRHLPLDIGRFTGRHLELKELTALAQVGDVTPIVVVTGPAGIGKTALVVHWAHQVADRFPDGQLYANLRGFDSSGVATKTADTLRAFLDALAVAPQQIPASLEAQIGMYRTLLANRRVLVVLDNAKDAEQVRPLLPGSPGSMAVITSRASLSGLVTAEAAYPMILELLTIVEARQLLAQRIGPERTDADPEAVDAIIARCAGLPLALAIVAAQAATRPRIPVAELAAELRKTYAGLDPFADSDPAIDLRAVFSWSYLALSPGAARLFRLLGLAPGPSITSLAAASLGGIDPQQTAQLLAELTEAHLVDEHLAGRYDLHDLLETYAGELARAVEPQSERHQAIRRIVDHYLHSAYAANCLLQPVHVPIELAQAQPASTPRVFDSQEEASQWIQAEQPALMAAVESATDIGLYLHAEQLAEILTDFLHRQARWHDCLAIHHAYALAAKKVGHLSGQAHAMRCLALAQARLGHHDEAVVSLDEAIALLRLMDDQHGLARAHRSASMIHESAADYSQALQHAEQACRLFRELSDEAQEAKTLNLVGWCHAQLGDFAQAMACCEQALVLVRRFGDRHAEAATLDSLGYAQHHLGQHDRAIASYQLALSLAQGLGFQAQETETLIHLGDTHLATGSLEAARSAWKQALDILEGLHHPGAADVRKRLT